MSSNKENFRLKNYKNVGKDSDVRSGISFHATCECYVHVFSATFCVKDMRRRRNDITVELRKVSLLAGEVYGMDSNVVFLCRPRRTKSY